MAYYCSDSVHYRRHETLDTAIRDKLDSSRLEDVGTIEALESDVEDLKEVIVGLMTLLHDRPGGILLLDDINSLLPGWTEIGEIEGDDDA